VYLAVTFRDEGLPADVRWRAVRALLVVAPATAGEPSGHQTKQEPPRKNVTTHPKPPPAMIRKPRAAPPPGAPRRLVRVHFDAQQAPADEDIVAVRQRPFRLDPHVGPVAAVEIGEQVLALALLDGGVAARHVHVGREVEVAVLAPDVDAVAARAD